MHNIHQAIGEVELRNILEPYGKLDHVAFSAAGVGGQLSGSAMVTFCESEHAIKVILGINFV